MKFIRFGQWRIDKTGSGILAFITNHGFLDNPTFRGMRQELMSSFNKIYILDIHGNSKKKEVCPDGSKDENVFDIQQGVSVNIFIKNQENTQNMVFHSDLWGLRNKKYKELLNNDVGSINWEKINPKTPFYLFKPQNTELFEEYEKGYKITDLMKINSAGIITARDNFTIKNTPEEVFTIITDFVNLEQEEARIKYNLGKDVRDWKVKFAQEDLKSSGLDKDRLVPILYRPFDTKYTYYTGNSRGFHCMPRGDVMKHMINSNMGLICSRQMDKSGILPIFVTNKIIDGHSITSAVSISSLFPLFLYNGYKHENIDKSLLSSLSEVYDRKISAEDLFYYIYAILNSNNYRNRYIEFLKMDYPRIPFTSRIKLFDNLSKLGKELVSLHLFENNSINDSVTELKGNGNNEIKSIGKSNYKDNKLFINNYQYFDNITLEIYNFQIGSHHICTKWLKDRKGKLLKDEEINHYQKIIFVINETIKIVKQIDETIEKAGGWPID